MGHIIRPRIFCAEHRGSSAFGEWLIGTKDLHPFVHFILVLKLLLEKTPAYMIIIQG